MSVFLTREQSEARTQLPGRHRVPISDVTFPSAPRNLPRSTPPLSSIPCFLLLRPASWPPSPRDLSWSRFPIAKGSHLFSFSLPSIAAGRACRSASRSNEANGARRRKRRTGLSSGSQRGRGLSEGDRGFLHGANLMAMFARGFLRDRKFRSTAVSATRAWSRENCVSRFDDSGEGDEGGGHREGRKTERTRGRKVVHKRMH